jgi:nucleoside-diphosphate-sugar epimerase
LLKRPGLNFHQLDISKKADVRCVFCREPVFDAVINLAARAGVRQSVEDPWIYADTNIIGTLNLLELCRESGAKKFLLASTSSLYGAHNPTPFREDADTNRVLSPYAASKKAAEVLCYTYHHLYGLDIAIPRYFTVYGPAGRPDMSLFRFVQWISEGREVTVYGDGQQSRDFTFVDDIAKGTISCLGLTGYNIVNLGSDRPQVLMDVIRLIEGLLGRRANIKYLPLHPADVTATWADIRNARERLKWEPETPFTDGVKMLVDWYVANRDWAREVRT